MTRVNATRPPSGDTWGSATHTKSNRSFSVMVRPCCPTDAVGLARYKVATNDRTTQLWRTIEILQAFTCSSSGTIDFPPRNSSDGVEKLDKRTHGTVHSSNFWVRRLNRPVLVRSVRAAAMPKAEVPGSQLEWFSREDYSRPGTRIPRPQHWVNSVLFIGCDHRLYQRRVRRCLRGVIASTHVDLDVTKAMPGQMCCEQIESFLGRHVRNEAHVELRDSPMGEDCLAARAGISTDQTFNIDRWLRDEPN